MNEDTYDDNIFYGTSFACLVPPNKYVLNVKLNVAVVMSSYVASNSSGWSSLTESDMMI